MLRKIVCCGIAVFIGLLLGGVSYAQLKIVNDPAAVGVGARSLGMGGILLNFSDISSLFGNPAALVSIEEPQVTLMSGRFLNQVDYYSGGVVFPTFLGVAGIGYSRSQLTLTGPLSTIEAVDGIIIVPSTTEVRTDSYMSSTLQISLSRPLKDMLEIERLENVMLGGTLKIFAQELSTPSIARNASGYELDLGMQYPINPELKFSLVGKNVLPASLGGKLRWKETGREETFPYFIRAGLQYDLERETRIFSIEKQSISAAIEYDYRPQGQAPNLLHYGVEWGIGDILDIRAGIDQGYIGEGGTTVFEIANNLSYGVGISYQGWRFDYAFHEYYGIPENNTHYFSFTYGLPYEEEAEEVPEKVVVSPEDELITDRDRLEISGRILDPGIVSVFVADRPVVIVGDSFSAQVNLSLGKNIIKIYGVDRERKIIFSKLLRALRLVAFRDVPEDYWARESIEIMATLGIIMGYPGEIFSPDRGITRAEFATLLARILGEGKYAVREELPFTDFPAGHWAYTGVAYALDNDLIKGYPDGTFRPNQQITRAEGVVVIARFAGLDLQAPVDILPYLDVPGRHWAVSGINAAKTAGLLEFVDEYFYPNQDLTRAEAAEILSRVGFIKERVDELLSFETGY